jgi:hypothetical protein
MQKQLLFIISIFITYYSQAQTIIFQEDFQNGISNSWTLIDNDGLNPVFSEYNNAWIAILDPENPLDTVASSTSYFNPIGKANRWLITPQVTLGAFGNFLEWNGKSQDASYPDDYMVLISTTGTQISDFTDTLLEVSGEIFEWTTRSIDVSAQGFNNQSVHFAFVENTMDGYKLYLDSIKVIKDDPSFLNEISEINFSIYPNPTSSKLIISSSVSFDKIIIYNELGQILITSTSKEINVANFENGIYTVELISNNQISRKRFIKN